MRKKKDFQKKIKEKEKLTGRLRIGAMLIQATA